MFFLKKALVKGEEEEKGHRGREEAEEGRRSFGWWIKKADAKSVRSASIQGVYKIDFLPVKAKKLDDFMSHKNLLLPALPQCRLKSWFMGDFKVGY